MNRTCIASYECTDVFSYKIFRIPYQKEKTNISLSGKHVYHEIMNLNFYWRCISVATIITHIKNQYIIPKIISGSHTANAILCLCYSLYETIMIAKPRPIVSHGGCINLRRSATQDILYCTSIYANTGALSQFNGIDRNGERSGAVKTFKCSPGPGYINHQHPDSGLCERSYNPHS